MSSFVWAVRPDRQAQNEAKKAGQKDGDKQPPPQGMATEYISQLRESVATANAERAAATRLACTQPLLNVQTAVTAGGRHGTQAAYHLHHVVNFVRRFDDHKDIALTGLATLEKVYMDEAVARWRKNGQIFAIPEYESEDEIEDLRRTYNRYAEQAALKFSINVERLGPDGG